MSFMLVTGALRNDNQGRVYVAIFSGPDAHERAQEYADWKTSMEERRPIRKAG